MGEGRRTAALTALALLAGACADSGEADTERSAGSDDTEVVTRAVTQVVVIGAGTETVAAISALLVDYDAVPELEQVAFIGAPLCDQAASHLISCWSEPLSPGPTAGRRAIVVLDGDIGAAREVADVMGAQQATIVAGEPQQEAAALAELGSGITFVPAGLSELVSDPMVTFLVGVNDELAAFEPVSLGDDLVARLASNFFDARLVDLARPSTDALTADDPVPEPDVRWVLDLPEPTIVQGIHERVVVVDGVVAFLGNDGVARGVDSANGTVLWSREFVTDATTQSESFVSAAGNTLLLSYGGQGRDPDPDPDLPDRSLLALDVRTGDTIWQLTVSAEGAFGHPATDGERVFVWIAEDTDTVSLRALDVGAGAEIWRTGGSMGFGPPLVDGGEVWTGSEDGALRGFDALTGNELVRFDEAGLGLAGVASRPAASTDRIFFGNDNGTFYAIDRTSGDLVWSFPTDSINLPSSPVIADDIIIFGSFDGGVYGLDVHDGTVRWRYDRGEDLFVSSAALSDGRVYLASFLPPSSLLALDARTGEAVWELPIGEQTAASPFVAGDTVYLQSPGKLWAVTR